MTIRMLLHISKTLSWRKQLILIQFSRTFRSSPMFISFSPTSKPLDHPLWRWKCASLLSVEASAWDPCAQWSDPSGSESWRVATWLTQMKRLVKYSTYLILTTLHNNQGLRSIHSIQIVFFNPFYLLFFLDKTSSSPKPVHSWLSKIIIFPQTSHQHPGIQGTSIHLPTSIPRQGHRWRPPPRRSRCRWPHGFGSSLTRRRTMRLGSLGAAPVF